jgi:hypothetical protein
MAPVIAAVARRPPMEIATGERLLRPAAQRSSPFNDPAMISRPWRNVSRHGP